MKNILKAEVLKTPLIEDAGKFLKLEYQQAGASYKIRGLHSLLIELPAIPESMAVLSAGNMARSLLILASDVSKITVYVPDSIPRVKEEALRSFPCTLVKIPMSELWKMVDAGVENYRGPEYLVHPVDRPSVLKGYASLARELIAEKANIDEVFIPFGVGGLYLGVAQELKALNPAIKIIAVESSVKHPLYSEFYGKENPALSTWVDAIGTPYVLRRVLQTLKNFSLVDEICLIDPEEAKVVAQDFYKKRNEMIEGAAALALTAVKNNSTGKNSVAILTGANVNPEIYSVVIRD